MLKTPINTLFNAVSSTCGRMIFILPRLIYIPQKSGEQLYMSYEVAFVSEPTDVITCRLRYTEFDIDVFDLSNRSWRYTPDPDCSFRKQKVLYLRNDPDWTAPNFEKSYQDAEESERQNNFDMSQVK